MIQKKTAAGFTLVELMITVAIVGILAAIAYPSYQSSVRSSWRANAASCLSELAQRMERRYTNYSSYIDPDNADIPQAACLEESGMNTRYDFRFFENPTVNTFVLLAAPDGQGPQAGDPCGGLTIDEMGRRGVLDATLDVAECWRR